MTSPKNIFYLFAFLEGAAVMAIELLAAKMLAPYFGSGLYTWGSVIGITLVSLALGYYLGGITADKFTNQNSLFWVVLFSSVFIILMPSISKSLTIGFVSVDPIVAVIILSIILILPSLLLLGMVPVLLIRLLSEKVESSGRVTGIVYTVSTLGGIFSVFFMGFYIIPEFGLSIPAIIIGLILGIISFFVLLSRGKIVVLIYFIIVAFAFYSVKQRKVHSNVKVLYQSEGLLGQLLLADISANGRNERILFVNRMGQTFININTGRSRWSYVDYLISVASALPENSDVLLLGLGGGTIANQLQQTLKFNVDAVELDERMVNIARRFFSLDVNTNVIIDDARHYLESTEKTYDLIIFDVFKGEVPPAHVLSVESFEKALTRLNPEGFMIVNFNGFLNGDAGKAGRSLYKTLEATGLITKILPTYEEEKYRNNLFIAMQKQDLQGFKMKRGTVPNRVTLFKNTRLPLERQGEPVDIETLFINIGQLDLDDASVITDDKPLLERYNHYAARIWREEYNRNYTEMFLEKGVPLFD
ncbi:MAG: fused MFS/spermidine synthase [Bacteroidota bacterium]